MAIRSKITPMLHRRSFMVASAAAAIAPDFARAQSPVPNQLDWGKMTRADRDPSGADLVGKRAGFTSEAQVDDNGDGNSGSMQVERSLVALGIGGEHDSMIERLDRILVD